MLVGAFLSSLGLGTGLALALGLQSNLFRDERHLESETGQPMLGIFPCSPNHGAPERIAINHPLSLEAECLYRVLTEVLDASTKARSDSGKIVLLTSAAPNEGKTSYSLALGLAASRMGLSTVVLDCDMWHPGLVAMMRGLEPHPETSELFETSPAGDYDEAAIGKELLIDHTTGLNVLPLSVESRESPYIALGSSAMRRLLQTLRRKYDLILLDTPPLMARVDALPLACLADKVILLVDQQHTPRGAVIKVIDMLRRQGAPTTGVVFSKVNLRKYGRVNGSQLYSAKYSGSPRGKNVTSPLPTKEKN
jgi:succinoglycan biosynthesis transport protein ExoP